ncbi:hypothetical protein GLX28_10065 [Deinococcus xianganensis]|uniref:Peptidase S24/S26A/S26B/S26C domain-containing protein n=2 Tax=Deinococcus xianganensis TaxID=1507289 RepID=A0A6I4YSA7_9DEIO|nr:S24 family peptidase [Deinococcus xianganensis]MXV19983.1 hypothetical protein [Deinococcus xianganensis]
MNIPRQNIRKYLLALRDLGLIKYNAIERQRALVYLTENGFNLLPECADKGILLPLLGSVAAGRPIAATSEIERYVRGFNDLFNVKEGDFLLKIQGRSMEGVGMYSGDFVIIRPGLNTPNNGEIVLVILPDSQTATLKYWHCKERIVTLHSANPDFPPMQYMIEELEVRGRAIGHIGTERQRKRYLN